jgi:hypothetical protein
VFGRIAQLVEQRTENPCVAGSIPAPATTSFIHSGFFSGFADASKNAKY